MTKQTVNVGLALGDGKGDPTRTAFTKTNSNFDDAYSSMGNGTTFYGTGTTGAVFGLLNTSNTHSGNNTFSGSNTFSKTIAISDNLKYDGTPNYMLKGASAGNKNYGYVATAASDTVAGSIELGVLGDTVRPVYARQRNAAGTILKSLTLLDAAGDTTIPGRMLVYPNVASGNAGLILGDQTTANNTYVDFSPTATTYIDARIQATGGSSANYGGILTYYAVENVFQGKVTVNGQLAASNVAITGGAINGTPIGATTQSTGKFSSITLTTDLAIADGGTGASTAAAARQNLSLYSTTEIDTAITNATPAASQSKAGLIQIATAAEALNGSSQVKAITPSTLRSSFGAANTAAPMLPCYALLAFSNIQATGTYSQADTTITVTMTGHGASVGNQIYLTFTSGAGVSGLYTVTSVPSSTTFTVTSTLSQTTSGNITKNLIIFTSVNILSVSDDGVGLFTITFINPLPSADYVPVAMGSSTLGAIPSFKVIATSATVMPTTKTASAVQMGHTYSGTATDSIYMTIAFLGG